MGVAEHVLGKLVDMWPERKRVSTKSNAAPNTPQYYREYVEHQFAHKVSYGFCMETSVPSFVGKDVLELGCGPGGIATYLACLGARRVVGIDLDAGMLEAGRKLVAELNEAGRGLNVELFEMDCHELEFDDGSFDAIVADNLFEHVVRPGQVMSESYRVLRPGGRLLVPTFSSYESKYGLHLKSGLRVPWANLFFSEATIIDVMKNQAEKRPELWDYYPGLSDNPTCVRDMRKYKDLNEITHAEFLDLARSTGFEVEHFRVFAPAVGRALRKIAPHLERTRVFDVLSTGATAILRRPTS